MTKDLSNGLGLDGQVVFITGAGRGIGFAAAKLMGRCGARIAAHDISEGRLTSLLASLNGDGVDVLALAGDGRREEDVNQAVARAVDYFGEIDVLVNNVGGLVSPAKDFTEISLEEFEETVELNLLTNVLFSRAVVPVMKANGGGRIVNVSSALALRGVRLSHIGYDAGKGAVCGLTRALAFELAKDRILVNAVAPSSVLTEATIESGAAEGSLYAGYPLGRASSPEEIAGVIAFLASGWATYCTGETFVVSGGQFIGTSQA
jgi:3-oxoacyl-[acyl-carrier protein] reductase